MGVPVLLCRAGAESSLGNTPDIGDKSTGMKVKTNHEIRNITQYE